MDIDVQNDAFFKAHAVFMTLAWGFLAGFGLINARFFKAEFKGQTSCGLGVWFANHRHSMVLATLLTIVGFVVIFWRVDGFLQINSERPWFFSAHPAVGVTVTLLAVTNPIMAIFRGGKDAPQRWYFNWAHWFVGESAFLLGYLNILLGMKLPAQGTISKSTDFWLVVVYGLMHAAVEVILFLSDRMCKPADDGELTKLNDIEGGAASKKWLSSKVLVLSLYTTISLVIVLTVCGRMATA